MATTQNDPRYRAHCYKCHAILGDWALRVPEQERVCWDCRSVEKILKNATKDYKPSKGGEL